MTQSKSIHCLIIRPFLFVLLNQQDLLEESTPVWQLNVKGPEDRGSHLEEKDILWIHSHMIL